MRASRNLAWSPSFVALIAVWVNGISISGSECLVTPRGWIRVEARAEANRLPNNSTTYHTIPRALEL